MIKEVTSTKYITYIEIKKFIQTNISYSKQNVIRGLHYQCMRKQSQLVTIIEGEINYIVVDIMPKSKHFKKYRKYKLSSKYNNQIYVPGGFANGFELYLNMH